MRLELEHRSNAPLATLDEPTNFEHEISDDPAVLVKKGIAAAQKGDREHARELLTRATDIHPASEDAWMWLASISDYPEELLAFLNKVLGINSANKRAVEWHAATRSLLAKTFVQRGIAAYNKGSVELADSCFDQAVGHDDKCAVAWFWKARVSSFDDTKIEYLERSLAIDPDNDAARQALESLKPTPPEATIEDAKWAAVAGKRKVALEILDEVLVNGHSTAEAWILRSHLTLRLPEKVEALEMALELEPENQIARASYDFLTATVRDAHSADERALVEDVPVEAAEEPAVEPPADDRSVEPDMSMETKVQETTLEPVEETPSEGRSIEEIFDSAAEYVDPDDLTIESLDSSLFEEAVDEVSMPDEPAEIYEPGAEHDHSDEAEPEYEVIEATDIFAEDDDLPVPVPGAVCGFCKGPVETQAFECGHCHAVLTLSDIELLLANANADHITIEQSITQMEADRAEREFDLHELTVLGIGYFNLRNFEKGFSNLQEASQLDPNNVILGGQVNALAIRLDEIRRQDEIDGSKPKGKSILVVDDSPTVRKLISAKLEKSGHNVTCAADGVEGLEKLEGDLPDLVLLDIAMPRMDGYEVCKQIRSNPAAAGVPIVMISGKDGFFDKVRGKMAGCTGYVTKPFGPETLMKALETYLLPENGHAE